MPSSDESEGEDFPLEVAAKRFRGEDWVVPTCPKRLRGSNPSVGGEEYRWVGQEVAYRHQYRRQGKRGNSRRAFKVASHLLYICLEEGCETFVRTTSATQAKIKRAMVSLGPSHPGLGEKALRKIAREQTQAEPAAPGDGCAYCSNDPHAKQLRLVQLSYVEGLKRGEYCLLAEPQTRGASEVTLLSTEALVKAVHVVEDMFEAPSSLLSLEERLATWSIPIKVED